MLINHWLQKSFEEKRSRKRRTLYPIDRQYLAVEPLEQRCLLAGATQDDSTSNVLARVVLQHPDLSTELITLTGSATVRTFWDGPNAGDADDSLFGGGNGRDDVETRIVSLNLNGNSTMGQIALQLNPAPPAPQFGLLEEQVNNTPGRLDIDPYAPGLAQSFFDVFFSVSLDGINLHNNSSLQISGLVSQKPDRVGEKHSLVGPQVPLFDSSNSPSGFTILDVDLINNARIEKDRFTQTVAMVTMRQISTQQSVSVLLAGPTDIHVFFEGSQDGDAVDDTGDGLDEVHTEIVAMTLTGQSPLGPLEVRLRPGLLTTGQIIEQVNNTSGRLDVNPFAVGAANSFFDVFFEIQMNGPAGPVLYSDTPARVQGVIQNKPPGEGEKLQFIGVLPLRDQAGPVDWEITNIMHWVQLNLDWGDAPDPTSGHGAANYDTLSVNKGPSHFIVPGLMMGPTIDGELDGQPTVLADGDDVGGPASDDEDGLISAAADLALAEGVSPVVDVLVTKPTGADVSLYGWIDYDGDGFFETAEMSTVVIVAGTPTGPVSMTFPRVPYGSGDKTGGATYARFRLSTDLAASKPTGFAFDGEVEDYRATISGKATCVLTPVAPYLSAAPVLSWLPVTGADHYEVWFSQLFPRVARLYLDSSVLTTSWTPPTALSAGQFRYWVRAFDVAGNATPWSTPNTFQVRPTVISPTAGSFTNPTTFVWNAIPFASSYQLFLRTSTGDTTISGISGTTHTPASSLPTGTIQWWIRATGSPGGGGWSLAGNANTTPRAVVTGPVSPAGTTPAITWSFVTGAGRYVLQVIRVSTAAVVIREDTLVTTSFTPSTPLAAGGYRAWVKAISAATNSFATALWSIPFNFTVAASQSDLSDEQQNFDDDGAILVSLPKRLQAVFTAHSRPWGQKGENQQEVSASFDSAIADWDRNAGSSDVLSGPSVIVPNQAPPAKTPDALEFQLLDAVMGQTLLLTALLE